jgi:hypothetical protein
MLGKGPLVLVTLLCSWPAAAQVSCGDQPRDVPVEVQEQLKGDVQGRAHVFSRLLDAAELQGKVESTRRELYERHRDIDKSQLDRYMLWTTCQAIMADRTLTSQEKIAQYLVVYKALVGEPRSEAPRDYHLIVTEHLGLQFRQDDRVVPIRPDRDGVAVVALERAPFQIMLPARLTRAIDDEKLGLEITVAADPLLLRLAAPGSRSREERLFQEASGMADAENGSGRLIALEEDLYDEASPAPFNYIFGGRFNVEEDGKRGIYVSAIPIRYKRQTDLLRSASSIFLVARIDHADRPQSAADRAEMRDGLDLDLVRLDFVN